MGADSILLMKIHRLHRWQSFSFSSVPQRLCVKFFSKEITMKTKHNVYILLGLIIGGILGMLWGKLIENLHLYPTLGAIGGMCFGWLAVTVMLRKQTDQYKDV